MATPLPAIEGYELQQELGRGGAGVVYSAVRSTDKAAVAIKVLGLVGGRGAHLVALARSLGGDDARAPSDLEQKEADAFRREVRIQKLLAETGGFVPWLGGGVARSGHPYLVMPLLTGGTLRDRLQRGPLPIPEAIALGIALARSLAQAHELGVVHRDLKPENVLFTWESVDTGDAGRPLIADLGLAKHFDRDAPGASESVALSKTSEMKGTAGYAAPEQIHDAKTVGPPADVFSLGVILYECLAGAHPFGGGTSLERIARGVVGSFTPLEQRRPEVPAWLSQVVASALEPEVEHRIPSAAELVRALETHEGLSRRPPRRVRSGLTPLVVALVGMVVGGTLGGLGWRASSSPAPTPTVSAAARLQLELASPTEGQLVTVGKRVAVRGRARGAQSVRVNGTPVTPSGDGAFAVEVDVPGARVEVVARASDGHEEHLVANLHVLGSAAPDWYLKLSEEERCPLPLPAGVNFTQEKGTFQNDADGSLLVYVPAGTFVMGKSGDPLGPAHEVELSGYFMGKLEVTNEQFGRFIRARHWVTSGEKKRDQESEVAKEFGVTALQGTWTAPFSGETSPPPGNHPVVRVSWLDAMAYVEWAHLRLPTEAQWEKAAAWDPRERRARTYSWGDQPPGAESLRFANMADETLARRWVAGNASKPLEFFRGYDDGFEHLAPVGRFPEGTSFYGTLDMTGNASELCYDGCSSPPEPYDDRKALDPVVEPARFSSRIMRGASWCSSPSDSDSQHRWWVPTDLPVDTVGFRVALPIAR